MKDIIIVALLFIISGIVGAAELGRISLYQCCMLCAAALAVLFSIPKVDKLINIKKKKSLTYFIESNRRYRQMQYIKGQKNDYQ